MALSKDFRSVTRDGHVFVRMHPLVALVTDPAHHLADLWYSLPSVRSWWKYGDWRYSVRIAGRRDHGVIY